MTKKQRQKLAKFFAIIALAIMILSSLASALLAAY